MPTPNNIVETDMIWDWESNLHESCVSIETIDAWLSSVTDWELLTDLTDFEPLPYPLRNRVDLMSATKFNIDWAPCALIKTDDYLFIGDGNGDALLLDRKTRTILKTYHANDGYEEYDTL